MQAQILTLIIPAMTLIFSAVFIALWWQDRSRFYILSYAYWFAAVATGIALQAWIIKDFGPPEILLFHLLSSSGLIALLWGVAKRDKRRVPLLAFILVTLATGVVCWFARAWEVQPVLLLAQNFNAGLLFAMGAYGKWSTPHRHIADRVLLAAFVLLAAYSIFRPSVTVLLQSQMTMVEYQTSVMLAVNMAMTALLCLLLSFALVATIIADNMEKERVEASIDPLSGLPTRRAFEQDAKALHARASEERRPVSMIVADIDHFKRVNDTWGHSTGDRVIGNFSNLLSAQIRTTDVAGRIGGEEFCVVVWNCNVQQAEALANRIRKDTLELSARQDDEDVRVSASFGVAAFRPADSYTDAFKRADDALYAAKNSGRNRVCVSVADDEKLETTTLDRNAKISAGNVVSLMR
ncbi:GGDEF domain-containing protein [uncultured Erythrobacter sp.]|uniref:GGDEF domain-containing protein n=1 Tax=uncultured Erythrobacter sp. TaxID=263913 RepID=UPI002621BCEC|nr:GGDEF domain-containing protein [uncultured Erythrobacter sp.]